ncbi:hypothetical protein K461DRAFT_297193 [Myriangium duriaei CBS 260.36]|uniref:DUF2415 domain-containing protein n=1 Tax=Myriangium duriaei CBS 260.36 TaxID=1168546 RepID=A0A9P4IUE5_9PEZI|nr:hypothetical protein K461DRAFT_297193 [Myriangium duriaei CBS 260.36]
MAIDSILYPPSDDLALPEKTFYPTKIPVTHWQLRHYISHPHPDVLYYASGQDIFYLNTATRKRKQIATLPFEARCTASGFGYVCVGGEYDGHFAIIKLEESRHVDVDVAIPLDHWNTTRAIPRPADIQVKRIGEHIVNSISIHKIHDEEAHLYDVVAVLTNNDSTVRVYSLTHGYETSNLVLPDPMNHATISPDGKFLAAVGDVNTVYFFSREMSKDPPQIPKPHNRLDTSSADWIKAGQYSLYIPGPGTQKGYFTTAWSPRGHLLAVGSEAGYITVFDMETFRHATTDPEATRLVTIPSSRPDLAAHVYPGAIRSMCFSPDPWDLLIWAEDQGRICIGDLRTGLQSKQIVELDPKDKALNRCELDDLESDEDLRDTQRLLELEDEYAQRRLQGDDDDDNLEEVISQERRRRLRSLLTLENDPNGLTADEQRILESLRTTRQREEARSSGATPTSINYTNATLFDHTRGERSASNEGSTQESQRGSTTTGTGTDIQPRQRQLLRDLSRSASRYITSTDSDRATNEYMLPPIRTTRSRLQGQAESESQPSVVRARNSDSSSATIPPYALRAASSQQATSRRDSDDGPWRIISDAMNLARGPLFDNATSERDRAAAERERERDPITSDHVRALNAQRERLRTLQRNLEAQRWGFSSSENVGTGANATQPLITRYPGRGSSGIEVGLDLLRRRDGRRPGGLTGSAGTEIGVRTAGLAISRDGRTVWAATEEGVFEIGLNLKSRLRMPAVDLR